MRLILILEELIMWSKRRAVKEATNVFGMACQELNLNGYKAHDNQNREYFVVEAPEGAIRTYRIEPLLLQDLTDGWNNARALWEIRKDVIMGLCAGYDEFCTSPFDISKADDNYMFNVEMALRDFFSKLPTY